jgi:hypothetical protein
MLGIRLPARPYHEQAVIDAAQQSRRGQGRRAANVATVVVVRDVQPLMQTIFDAGKASPIEFQPPVLLCIASARRLITLRLQAWLKMNLATSAAPMKT